MSEGGRNAVAGGSLGFGSVLTIVFVILKLTKTIDWSWWWVLAPTWIPIAFTLLIVISIISFYAVGTALRRRDIPRRYE